MAENKINSAKQFWEVLSDEEAFQKIYYKCLENRPQVSETVSSGYKTLNNALDEYMNATQEDMFRYAYWCGYEAAAADLGRKIV